MFYSTDANDHGLPHNPFKAVVSPRPIGWVSTLDAEGNANLAPFSYFNAVQDAPPMVLFSAGPRKSGTEKPKDSPTIIRETGEFCVNIVSYDLRDKMNITSGHYPRGTDEFELAGLTKRASRLVAPPHVAESPAVLECKAYQMVDLPGGYTIVIGHVVGIHLDEAHIRDGIFEITSFKPLTRLGYRDYAAIGEVFSLKRPGES